jgi:FkbM family methyltransferase
MGSVSPPPFQSYSQNGEDVVLWRALRGVDYGRYIEVGANHPCRDSVSMAFYKSGWTGITVEPDPHYAALLREHRPGDVVVEAAITPVDRDMVTLHVVDGTGLSTLDDARARVHARSERQTHDIAVLTRTLDSVLEEAGWSGQEIHFMSVDTEGSERMVIESIDLGRWRPWVLVVEATEPNTTRPSRGAWEGIVLEAGYQFCFFDGLSCFYVSAERSQQLSPALSYPACILDNYIPPAQRQCEERLNQAERHCEERVSEAQQLAQERAEENQTLIAQVVRWRAAAITRWAAALSGPAEELMVRQPQLEAKAQALQDERNLLDQEVQALRRRVADLESSTSWRVTRPLRSASGVIMRARGRR